MISRNIWVANYPKNGKTWNDAVLRFWQKRSTLSQSLKFFEADACRSVRGSWQINVFPQAVWLSINTDQ